MNKITIMKPRSLGVSMWVAEVKYFNVEVLSIPTAKKLKEIMGVVIKHLERAYNDYQPINSGRNIFKEIKK